MSLNKNTLHEFYSKLRVLLFLNKNLNFVISNKCLPGGGPPNFLCPFSWTMLYPVFSIRASKAASFWVLLLVLPHPFVAAVFSSCISATASTEYHRYFRAGKSKLLSEYRNYQSTEKHNLCYIWLFNVTLFSIRLQSYMQLLPSTYLFSKHCSVAVIIFNSKQQFYILCVVGFFFYTNSITTIF